MTVPVGPRIEVPYPVMTDAGFPHGLRCDSCGRSITEGQPYREDVESVWDNGDTLAMLRCVYCPLGDGGCPDVHYVTCCGCGEVWPTPPLGRGVAWMCPTCEGREFG